MTLLQLATHLDVGGVTTYVLLLAEALKKRGHRVIMASDSGARQGELAEKGIEYWPVPLRTSAIISPRLLIARHRLSGLMRQHKIDLVHAHTRVSQVVGYHLARRFHIPFVTTWHGFFRRNLGRRLWPCFGDRAIAISKPVEQHLIADLGLPRQAIRLVPNGIDLSPFLGVPGESVRQNFLAKLDIPLDAMIVGTVARLVPSKGVDQLIRSLPLIRQSRPDVHLLIVGDGEARQRLTQLATALGAASFVHLTGSLPETRTALSTMRIFVFLPADKEGFGLSLLEAMASGKPVVAVRRGGGATWLLDESRVGCCVEPDDPQSLAKAILTYLNHEALALENAERGQALVQSHFSLSRMVDGIEAVYEELLSSKQ